METKKIFSHSNYLNSISKNEIERLFIENDNFKNGETFITADLFHGLECYITTLIVWNGFRIEYIHLEFNDNMRIAIDKIIHEARNFGVEDGNIAMVSTGISAFATEEIEKEYPNLIKFHKQDVSSNPNKFYSKRTELAYNFLERFKEGVYSFNQYTNISLRSHIVRDILSLRILKNETGVFIMEKPNETIKGVGFTPFFTDCLIMRELIDSFKKNEIVRNLPSDSVN